MKLKISEKNNKLCNDLEKHNENYKSLSEDHEKTKKELENQKELLLKEKIINWKGTKLENSFKHEQSM